MTEPFTPLIHKHNNELLSHHEEKHDAGKGQTWPTVTSHFISLNDVSEAPQMPRLLISMFLYAVHDSGLFIGSLSEWMWVWSIVWFMISLYVTVFVL